MTEVTGWVVEWAGWGWGLLFGGVLVFELWTLYWNRKYGDGIQRANLTAYVTALIGVGKRRLNRRMSKWVMVGFLGWLILHFLGVM